MFTCLFWQPPSLDIEYTISYVNFAFDKGDILNDFTLLHFGQCPALLPCWLANAGLYTGWCPW